LFHELCKLFSIQKTRTAPYYPQSDGLVERLFRTIKDMLFATVKTSGREWKEVLPMIEMGLRSTIQNSTKCSPFEVVFGRTMKLPIMWAYPNEVGKARAIPQNKQTMSDYILEFQQKLAQTHRKLAELAQHRKQPSRGKEGTIPWNVGQQVMARILPEKKGIDIPKYAGPFVIIQKLGEWTYRLQHTITKQIMDRNHHHLKIITTSPDYSRATIISPSSQPIPARDTRNRRPVDRYGFQI
jgi:hypothetical protein